MRKTITMLVLLLICARMGFGQDTDVAKVLHQNTNNTPTVRTVINKSLRFLQDNQNRDGSWSRGSKAFIDTSLAISAFLRMGETKNSEKYGSTISKAHEWLLAACPESANERTAVVIALSDYHTLHADTITAARVASLLENTNTPSDIIWADILSCTRLSDESTRPEWCSSIKSVQGKYASLTNNILPETKAEYLNEYAVASAKFRSGGKRASEYYHILTDKVLKRQQDDGSFPSKVEDDKTAITALAILLLTDLNLGAYQFHPRKRGKELESAEKDQEIKITL